MIGTSAGAAGTELNCDYLADELHKVNPNIDVRCVSDSGTLHPPYTISLWFRRLGKSCVYVCVRVWCP